MDMSFLFGRVAQSARCFPVTDLTGCHVTKYSVLGRVKEILQGVLTELENNFILISE